MRLNVPSEFIRNYYGNLEWGARKGNAFQIVVLRINRVSRISLSVKKKNDQRLYRYVVSNYVLELSNNVLWIV